MMSMRGLTPPSPDPGAISDAVDSLRAVLQAIERGDIEARTSHDTALVRRLEGAVAALEAVFDSDTPPTHSPGRADIAWESPDDPGE